MEEKLMNAVEVKDLTKDYGNFSALRAISFNLQEGHALYVYGKNGAGKTTLLEVIAGLRKQSSGTINLFGKEVTEDNPVSSSRMIGIFEESFLYSDLDVMENLNFYAKLYGISDIGEKAQALLSKFNMSSKKSSLIKHLSCGQEKVVAVIRGLMSDPKVLILDEPMKGLDSDIKRKMLGYINDALKAGTTLIFSSHDSKTAQEIATDMICIEDGSLTFQGTLAEGQSLLKEG